MVEYVPPLPEPKEEEVSPMRVEEPGTLKELSATQMMENILGDLEPEVSDLSIAPQEARGGGGE